MARALAISRSGWLSWSVRMFLSDSLRRRSLRRSKRLSASRSRPKILTILAPVKDSCRKMASWAICSCSRLLMW